MRLIRIVVNAITLLNLFAISIVSFSLPLCTHREARKDGLDLSNWQLTNSLDKAIKLFIALLEFEWYVRARVCMCTYMWYTN